MDFKLLLLIGFLAVFIGMLIAFSKHQEEKTKTLFAGIFIIILGFVIVSMAYTQACVDYKIKEAKQDILQIIYEQKYNDEINYSVIEINSVIGDTTYRQCSKNT